MTEEIKPLGVDECTDLDGIGAMIEAILFAAGYPVKNEKICSSCNITKELFEKVMESGFFAYEGRGIRLIRFEDSCQLCSNEFYEKNVKVALGMRLNGALSQSALEVLAIVAYNQPVTKAFVEQARGVDCTYAITTLCEKQLIEVTGKLEVPGRPNLYSTTETFLRCFGLSSVSELPKSEVLEAALGKSEENSGDGEEQTDGNAVENVPQDAEIPTAEAENE